MPSLAQGYVRGMLLGRQWKQEDLQRQREELNQLLLREQIEDIKSARKQKESLLGSLAEKEKMMYGLGQLGFGEKTAGAIAGYQSPQDILDMETERLRQDVLKKQAMPTTEKPSAATEAEQRGWQQFQELQKLGQPEVGPPVPGSMIRQQYLERKFTPKPPSLEEFQGGEEGATETTFYGAKTYDEAVQSAEGLSPEEKALWLKEAKEFFGVK